MLPPLVLALELEETGPVLSNWCLCVLDGSGAVDGVLWNYCSGGWVWAACGRVCYWAGCDHQGGS